MGGRVTKTFISNRSIHFLHSFQKHFPRFCILWALSSLSDTKFDLTFGTSVHQNENNTGVKCSDISVQRHYFIGAQVSMVTVLCQINRGWIEQRVLFVALLQTKERKSRCHGCCNEQDLQCRQTENKLILKMKNPHFSPASTRLLTYYESLTLGLMNIT